MTNGWVTRWTVLIALTAGTATSLASAQDDTATEAQDAATTVGAEKAAETDQKPARRPMLLRQGSHLLRAVGDMAQDQELGSWTLTIEPRDERSAAQQLTVMPCSLLDEMERLIKAAPGYELKFEVTGEVYVYKKRNYFMPTHPPLLVGRHKAAAPPPAEDPPTEDGAERPKRDTTDDIIRDLEDAAGLFAHRPEAPAAGDGADSRRIMREGTMIVSRRGHIRRTGGGAYIFIFDADAEGQADPPMILLPCLLLERLEKYSWRVGDRAVVLMSGHVHAYHGVNYLLPTVYRIPYQRTRLTP